MLSPLGNQRLKKLMRDALNGGTGERLEPHEVEWNLEVLCDVLERRSVEDRKADEDGGEAGFIRDVMSAYEERKKGWAKA